MLSKEKLKFLRQLHNISQKKLGEEINCSKCYISMVENGKEKYSNDFCNRYVNAVYKIAEEKNNKKNLKEFKNVDKEVKEIINK